MLLNLNEALHNPVTDNFLPTSFQRHVLLFLLFVSGLIKAIQLDYSEAHKNLMNAVRKAPQHVAIGFKQHVSTQTHTDNGTEI